MFRAAVRRLSPEGAAAERAERFGDDLRRMLDSEWPRTADVDGETLDKAASLAEQLRTWAAHGKRRFT